MNSEMDYCPSCGGDVLDEASYCHSCGEKLEDFNTDSHDSSSEEKEDDQENEKLKELESLLQENPELYDTLTNIEQRIIDALGVNPNN